MKIGDLVRVKDFKHPLNHWLITRIENRGHDSRGTLTVCKLQSLRSRKQGVCWKWTYELEKINENR